MTEETLTIPTRFLCPMCHDQAESYSRYAKDRDRYEAEERLRSVRASTPEKIRAAWNLYGKGHDWEKGGPVVHVPDYTPLSFARYDPSPEMTVKYATFQFHREVTRNSDFKVTRVHCMGVTVEETIS